MRPAFEPVQTGFTARRAATPRFYGNHFNRYVLRNFNLAGGYLAGRVPEREAVLYRAYADLAEASGNCVVPDRQAADKTGYSVRKVQRVRAALEAVGMLATTRSAKGNVIQLYVSGSLEFDRKNAGPFTGMSLEHLQATFPNKLLLPIQQFPAEEVAAESREATLARFAEARKVAVRRTVISDRYGSKPGLTCSFGMIVDLRDLLQDGAEQVLQDKELPIHNSRRWHDLAVDLDLGSDDSYSKVASNPDQEPDGTGYDLDVSGDSSQEDSVETGYDLVESWEPDERDDDWFGEDRVNTPLDTCFAQV